MSRLTKHRHTFTPLFLLFIIGTTRLFGLCRNILLARLFGVSGEAAAFELAQNLTSTLYETVIGALVGAMFVPAFAKRAKHSDALANHFAEQLLPALLVLTLFLYLPLLFFPRQIITLTAGTLSENTLTAAASATRAFSLAHITLSLSAPLTGILQTDGKPQRPALVYMTASFAALPFVILSGKSLTAEALAWFLLAIDLWVFVLLWLAVKAKHPLRFHLPRWKKAARRTKELVRKCLGVILYSVFLPLATLFASLLAARAVGEASLAANGYAIKWVLLSAALLSSSFHAVYYPRLSLCDDPRQKAKRPILALFFLSLLPSLLLFFGARPLLSLLYRGGSFTADAITLTSSLLRLYALSLPLLTLTTLFNDVAYLRGKTTPLAIGGILSLLLGGLAAKLLLPIFDIIAIPTAFFIAVLLRTTISAFLAFSQQHKAKQAEKARLLLVLSDEGIGGAGRQLLNYLACSDREHFDIAVLLPENAALLPMISAMNIPVFLCGTERSLSLPLLHRYYRIIRKFHPHILHANASLTARIAAFAAGVPVRIYTRHCVYPVSPKFRHALPRMAVGFATALLSTSVIAVAKEAAENLYGMGISKKRVTIIENGVPAVSCLPDERTRIREKYRIKESETVAVICCRLEKDKDVATLIEAAAICQKQEQPIQVLIVGKGSEEDNLRRLAAHLEADAYVHFCGFVSDVSPYLNAADVYVNCSVGTEATSLAIAEAMSISLPVIATDYGGNPAMVTDGVNGILVPQRSPSILADALTVMTDEALRCRFGNASREIYAARFSATKMAERNEALYRNLFTRKGYTLL